MKRNRFYLACLRDTLAGNVTFHCKDGRGYSTDVKKAHVYTREEAQKAWDFGREFDLPLSADHVDELLRKKVDMQLIENIDMGSPYVKLKSGHEGNFVCFETILGHRTTNLSAAALFDLIGCGAIYQSKKYMDSIAFHTFSSELINKRTMTQAAGLITPDRIKRERRRSNRNLERWNCPDCGKFVWQHNPHEFLGCNDRSCSEWKGY